MQKKFSMRGHHLYGSASNGSGKACRGCCEMKSGTWPAIPTCWSDASLDAVIYWLVFTVNGLTAAGSSFPWRRSQNSNAPSEGDPLGNPGRVSLLDRFPSVVADFLLPKRCWRFRGDLVDDLRRTDIPRLRAANLRRTWLHTDLPQQRFRILRGEARAVVRESFDGLWKGVDPNEAVLCSGDDLLNDLALDAFGGRDMGDSEPRRVCRRPFGLSYAANAGSSSMA